MPARAVPYRSGRTTQSGAALLIVLCIITVAVLTVVARSLNTASARIDRDKVTTSTLAQAKDALAAFASSVILTPAGSTRPGDLPCPDLNDDGLAEASCNIQNQRLGRLPWKTLGLHDLRDDAGERLWYAVSNNFKNSTRTGTLNSDTSGTITVRGQDGAVILNGTAGTGAIAVVISPGQALLRQGSAVVQDRSGSIPCPVATTPHCNPVNYLDVIVPGEDNATFLDSNLNGFIQGPIKDAAGTTLVNDRFIVLTPGDLMPLLEKRVAGETLKCLTDYAALAANQGHYPWAAALNPLAAPAYGDTANARFGRLPDTPFNQTRTDSGNAMSTTWGPACNIASSTGWWLNWKEMVFYAVALPYRPVTPLTPPACGVCLAVNPPSSNTTRQVAVFSAGRRLAAVAGGQTRTSNSDKATVANYLENQNATPGDDLFERSTTTLIFNDATAFAP